MNVISNYLQESKGNIVPFIIHKHNPRSGSLHYDLRFLSHKDKKVLHSWAFGSKFPDEFETKIVGVRTKDHNPRWLTLKSYRLDTFDQGTVEIVMSGKKIFELEFKGKIIKGRFKLFHLKSKRGDNWLLIKRKETSS